MSALIDYAQSCVDRIKDPEPHIMAMLVCMSQPKALFSISDLPLPPFNQKHGAWTIGILCANAYAAAGPGFDRRFRAERNRQRKIAAKLGLDFSEYDNTDTLPNGNCTRRQLLDAVPLAMDKAKGDGE